MDLISVIIPVYKVEKYLEKCVDSVRNQTYKNLEIILIDDGSPDNCGKMCDDLAKEDSRIKVIHKENEGLSVARNTGVAHSKGEFVCFIDSDDYISEDFCEILHTAITKTDSDVSSVSLRMVREDGYKIVTSNDLKESIESDELHTYEGKEVLRQVLLRESFKNYVCTKLYKRSIFDNCKFKEGISYEDVLFMYEISKRINKVAFINKECYFYLKRNNSITATCSEKNLNDFLDVAIYRYNDIKERNAADETYNIYALLESIISISIKYVIAKTTYEGINEKSNYIFEILKNYISAYENETKLISLLTESEKACLYLINYNIELFYSFIDERQKLKMAGKKI